MGDRDALLAAIRKAPEDDAVRLVYADWLEEHGGEAEQALAEFIRLQIAFEPFREDYESDEARRLREKDREYRNRHDKAWLAWMGPLYESEGVHYQLRRGFLDEIALPAKWFLEHGEAVRRNCPGLRRVCLFRFNGWGTRVAFCEHLHGLPELEIACWASPADFEALARSPHLAGLQVLQVWEHDSMMGLPAEDAEEVSQRPQVREVNLTIGRLLAASRAWPRLRELRLLGLLDHDPSGWLEAVNQAAGRGLGAFVDYYNEPIALAPVFGRDYLCGRLPDGRAVFVDTIGKQADPFHVLIYDERGRPQQEQTVPAPDFLHGLDGWERSTLSASIQAYLRDAIGFTPAFIRVKEVRFRTLETPCTYRYRGLLEEDLGLLDDPDEDPEEGEEVGGFGSGLYRWVKEGGYVFDCGNDWWCGKDGHVHST